MEVTQANVAKLYVATFNRAPDAAGLSYWANNSGLSIEGIAQSFFDQPETQTLYPSGTSNESFVSSVYSNLFNRNPDSEGLDYWVSALDSGSISKQHFILAVINGAQNTDISQDATILTNKQFTGLDFAAQGLDDVDFARTVMEHIDATNESVVAASTLIDKVVAPTGDFTEEIISGLTWYSYEDDYWTFSSGNDALFAATFNADGTVSENHYTAPFGSSDWILENSKMSTWNIVNGRIEIQGDYNDSTWNSTETLIWQTSTEMNIYEQWAETLTNETTDLSDDVYESGDNNNTYMFTQPQVRTESQFLFETGFFKETFSGQVNFVDSTGSHVSVPDDALVVITADRNYSEGRICLDINDDGSFSGTGYFGFDFSSSSLIEYYIIHDNNRDNNFDAEETCYANQTIDFVGISTPFTVII